MGWLNKLFGNNPQKVTFSKFPKDTAYVVWSCLEDQHSCDRCRAIEGTCWVPDDNSLVLPPLPECESKEKCRCMGIFVSKKESGADKVADFIRSRGGVATRGQMAHYNEVSKNQTVIIPAAVASYEINEADKLLKEATAKKRAGDIQGAIQSLKLAYVEINRGSMIYPINTYLRLPAYLQASGQRDEAWKELNSLLIKCLSAKAGDIGLHEASEV